MMEMEMGNKNEVNSSEGQETHPCFKCRSNGIDKQCTCMVKEEYEDIGCGVKKTEA